MDEQHRRKDDQRPTQPLNWDEQQDALHPDYKKLQRANPLIEAGALRQMRHRDGSMAMVFCYDKDITDRMLADYGITGRAPWAEMVEARKATGLTLHGLPVVIDDTVPPGVAEFRSGRRTVQAEITVTGEASQKDPSMAAPSKPVHQHSVDCFVEGTQVCGMGQAQPVPPVAATEQATSREMLIAEAVREKCYKTAHAFCIDVRMRCNFDAIDLEEIVSGIATPADAGAGPIPTTGNAQIDSFLADYEIRADEGVYSLTAHDRWVIANFMIELDEELPFLARLSTPAAPVTAEPVAWMATDEEGNADAVAWTKEQAARQTAHDSGKLVPLYAAPVSPQPAAQVPSIDREAVDGVHWDLFPGFLIDHHEGQTIWEESIQHWLAEMLKHPDYLAAVARKGQPAAAHAAHDQKGGEK